MTRGNEKHINGKSNYNMQEQLRQTNHGISQKSNQLIRHISGSNIIIICILLTTTHSVESVDHSQSTGISEN